jgi:hypothetical protein
VDCRRHPLWWKVYGRNKRFITLNLKDPKGRDLLQRLVPRFDVVMESFVPGTLERMGLGWDVLHGWNPRLILARISGWGQTGPTSQRPGFGTLIEAASGFAAMNGEPDGGPIVPSFPLADMTSALYTVNAIMFALYHRDVHNGGGQIVDVALFESLFSLLGPLAAEYEVLGTLRQRNGSRSKNAGPRGCYQTSDGRFIAVSGSTPKMAERFLVSYGLGNLLADERFATNEARVDNGVELDRGDRTRDLQPHARREPRNHQPQCPDRRRRADRRGHRTRSPLAVASAAPGRAQRRRYGTHAQRGAAPVGNARRNYLGRAERSAKTTGTSMAANLAWTATTSPRLKQPESFESA